MPRYGMAIDLDKCVRCRTCFVVCKVMHDIPNQFESGNRYTRFRFIEPEIGAYPNVRRHFLPVHCMQCEKPACVAVCPEKALIRQENGLIAYDPEKCIGCEACVEACPYNARYINEQKGVANGCDFCADRIAAGKDPWCVERCIGQAIVFGDLDDQHSPVSEMIRQTKAEPLSPDFGTRPKVFYGNMNGLSKIPGIGGFKHG